MPRLIVTLSLALHSCAAFTGLGLHTFRAESCTSCRQTPNLQSSRKHASQIRPISMQEAAVAEREGIALREDLRNIAIIAHVDHGKTTLVDSLLKSAIEMRENQQLDERVMDSEDQEKERGITILAKNVAINYKDTKINIIDTPGHADFGGEVERVLNMVDGVLLLVDAAEGPKPQTRFVLKKSLEIGLKVLVVVNKIDRPAARPEFVVDKTFDLFVDLGASDEQTDFEVVYASALNGISGYSPDDLQDDMTPLLDSVLNLPKPPVITNAPLQLQISNIGSDSFIGRLGIGRIRSGSLSKGQEVLVGTEGQMDKAKKAKVGEIFLFSDLGKASVETAEAGEIVTFAGISDFSIGDTVMDPADPTPLPGMAVEEPTMSMTFAVNKSPFAGKEGKKLTSRMIRDRLDKELETNVALSVKDTDNTDTFEVSGRGQLHLTVLVETMRREGFEMMLGPAMVLYKRDENGKLLEPYEEVDVEVVDEYSGGVISLFGERGGEMADMGAPNSEGYVAMQFIVPARGMLGAKNAVLSATRGTAVMSSVFHDYKPFAGDLSVRNRGSLLAFETGDASSFALMKTQDRGSLFVKPQEAVYENQIVGIHQRPGDLKVNICKTKQLNNMRAAGKDDNSNLIPPKEFTLEEAVEYIQDDELVEVTPSAIRMCKAPKDAKFGKKK